MWLYVSVVFSLFSVEFGNFFKKIEVEKSLKNVSLLHRLFNNIILSLQYTSAHTYYFTTHWFQLREKMPPKITPRRLRRARRRCSSRKDKWTVKRNRRSNEYSINLHRAFQRMAVSFWQSQEEGEDRGKPVWSAERERSCVCARTC